MKPSVLVVSIIYANFLCLQADAASNETDRITLLKFKEGVAKDPNGILDSWNESVAFCNWSGITCGHSNQRVESLVLEGQNLVGSISPYIGNLSFLRILNLQNNSLSGEIPREVGRLFRLQQLALNNNTLEGEIPVSLGNCTQLSVLQFGENELTGHIPAELGTLRMLQILTLGGNKLSGEIPSSLGNLTSLVRFSCAFNDMIGTIPESMGRLTSLTLFAIASNELSGTIPPSLFNITALTTISTAENQLTGRLPDNLGRTLPNLQYLGIAVNEFFGSIPSSISNATQLQQFDVSRNNFTGQVPTSLENLQNLWRFNVDTNSLGSNSSSDWLFLTSLTNCTNLSILDVSSNNFGGILPNSVANLSVQMTALYFGSNQIGGPIPQSLEHLINLNILGLESNLFSGVIPSYFGKFQQLQALAVSGNRLSGLIPSVMGNLTELLELYLSENNFEGSIPPSIENCQKLYYLDASQNNLSGAIPQQLFGLSSLSKLLNLSSNSFTGNLPAEIGKLANINTLDISKNKFSGEIPSTIGDCLALESLSMQHNSFQGGIPSSISSLKGLRQLDLSQNNLTGEIPQDLQNMSFLEYLNLSFNNLDGALPTGGVFGNTSSIFLSGNSKLCGGIEELHLPKCPGIGKKRKSHVFKLVISLTCAALSVIVISAFLVLFWIRKSKKSSSEIVALESFVKVSYKDLYQATGEFSPSNLIGSGSFGSVYKGMLQQVAMPVAIKVLNLQQKGASKSIKAESNASRQIRHRNLMKIISYVSSLDYKGNEFKALIYELMPNGNLDNWLHPESRTRNLNLLQRINIAVDVASALHYLHELGDRPIIHCDLKPSNVLLDDDMVARVSDFGLARLLGAKNELSEDKSSTIGVKGTIGYAAPEYGLGVAASKDGDTYSYGILVLEMFTGKRPTHEMFKEGVSLHDYVKAALPERLMQVLDATLFHNTTAEAETGATVVEEIHGNEIVEEQEAATSLENASHVSENVHKCLLSAFEIGIACSAESPRERMKLEDVLRKLNLVQKSFLDMPRNQRGRSRATPF